MAAFAVGAELTAMNVGMTISAMRAYILENQIGMALGAGHLLVHAAQRITSVVVIKLGIRPDRFPACVRMAVLARHRDGAVRVCYFGLRATYARTRAALAPTDARCSWAAVWQLRRAVVPVQQKSQ